MLKIALCFTILDNLIVLSHITDEYNFTWFSAMCRPVYLLISIRTLRDTFFSFAGVIWDTLPIMAFTTIFIMYYSWMGQRLFSGTLQGTTYFDTFSDSFFNMLVLMTTSNYPDIMLPAY